MKEETLAEGIRLINGDCREVLPTLGSVDVVVTDPPYGMSYKPKSPHHKMIMNDDETWPMTMSCGLVVSHSKYIFCRWDNLKTLPTPTSAITWVKGGFMMGDLEHGHARQTEIALFYPGPDHFFPNGRPGDVILEDKVKTTNHPTEKPVALMRRILEWTAGTIVDPFMGSGTTGVAAIELSRQFIGVELDEKYFDIACKRIEHALKQPALFNTKPKRATLTSSGGLF